MLDRRTASSRQDDHPHSLDQIEEKGGTPYQQLAYLRLKEVARITRWRVANGRQVHRDALLQVLAQVLASRPIPAESRPSRWAGLTYAELIRHARKCGVDLPDEAEFRALEERFDGSNFAFHRLPDKVGATLRLTRAEREAVSALGKAIITVGSIDETVDQRVKRKRNERKRDLEAHRLAEEARRRSAGAVPRHEYEANSASALKPWNDLGISRRTWYRKLKDRSLPANDGTLKLAQVHGSGNIGDTIRPTDLCQGSCVVVSQHVHDDLPPVPANDVQVSDDVVYDGTEIIFMRKGWAVSLDDLAVLQVQFPEIDDRLMGYTPPGSRFRAKGLLHDIAEAVARKPEAKRMEKARELLEVYRRARRVEIRAMAA